MDLDVVYIPSPQIVVDRMLELAQLTFQDTLVDLGCGDGRIVCTAARNYGCHAIGYDLDPQRISECRKNSIGLESLVKFEERNFFDVDLSEATVVTLYLLPHLNTQILPLFEKLRKGVKVISHDFYIDKHKHSHYEEVMFESISHNIFVYVLPLQLTGDM